MDTITKQSSEVRSNFGKFVDDVIFKSPQFVKRHSDRFFAVNLEHLNMLIPMDTQFHISLQEDDDNMMITTLAEIPELYGHASTINESINLLAEDLIQYAEDYFESFQIYVSDPNRRKHFPLLLKVLSEKNKEDVIRNLFVQHT